MNVEVFVGTESSLFAKLQEPQVWFPVFAAFVGYFLQSWIRMVFRRKDESRRAVIYLEEIAEEVENGLVLFEYMFEHGGEVKRRGGLPLFMTRESWGEGSFKSVLPDDVFQRIINVGYRMQKRDVQALRSHLKNYYVCICQQYERIAKKEVVFEPMQYLNSLEGARMVKKLVADCMMMMDRNARRNIWPW